MSKPEQAEQPNQAPSLEAPRLGQRKFASKPSNAGAGAPLSARPPDNARQRLDELKAGIIQLANKNFDKTMHILRAWQKEK